MTRYDAIVIGAGMSGMAAALRLAMFDRRVLLLERHELWGGLNSFYSVDGHAFDVGLHALTNYCPPRTKGSPLSKVLRQLRIPREELRLGEQRHSRILLPGLELTFTNDVEVLSESIAAAFPDELDGFASLVERVRAQSLNEDAVPFASGRAVLQEHLREPRLVEALLLPLLYYGSAREDDVEWRQLAILFRSIFLEGFARPEGGVRRLVNALVRRLRRSGAEVRLRTGVARILVERGAARGVVLDDGTAIEADQVFSSAGYVETLGLVDDERARPAIEEQDRGRLSFLESISVLDRPPTELGHDHTVVFYSTREDVRWRRAEELVDTASGVLCAPSNFAAQRPLAEPLLRITALANHDRWCALPEDAYRERKGACRDAVIDAVTRAFPERIPDWRAHETYRDVFTPRTIRHFTGHAQGAVYGSPRKRWDGASGIPGLHLIGTDQGYLGIVGALVSGIGMANRYGLAGAARPQEANA